MTTILAAGAMAGLGWYIWRRGEREKQRARDQAYWEKIRRECPSCAERRAQREAQRAGSAPS
jgi:hypothetical protein